MTLRDYFAAAAPARRIRELASQPRELSTEECLQNIQGKIMDNSISIRKDEIRFYRSRHDGGDLITSSAALVAGQIDKLRSSPKAKALAAIGDMGAHPLTKMQEEKLSTVRAFIEGTKD